MPEGSATKYLPALVAVLFAALVAAAAWQVREGQRLPDGPVPIAWEKEACAHCHMHLSERNYAVQLQTTSGDVLHFDDPGCFFLYEEHEGPEVHAVWFRHVKDDRWVSRDAVGFLEMASTPMDFGIGAVDGAEAGALTYEQARERALAKGHGPG